jgi:hypothetical protein
MENSEQNYYGYDFSQYGTESFNSNDYCLMMAMKVFCKNRLAAPCYREDPTIEFSMKRMLADVTGIVEMMKIRLLANDVELPNE